MGAHCFYSCKKTTKSSNLTTITTPLGNSAINDIDSQILSHLQSPMDPSPLSTTLIKDLHLKSKCSHMDRLRRLRDSCKTADRAISYSFSLSSQNMDVTIMKIPTKENMEDSIKELAECSGMDSIVDLTNPRAKTMKNQYKIERESLRSNSMNENFGG